MIQSLADLQSTCMCDVEWAIKASGVSFQQLIAIKKTCCVKAINKKEQSKCNFPKKMSNLKNGQWMSEETEYLVQETMLKQNYQQYYDDQFCKRNSEFL